MFWFGPVRSTPKGPVLSKEEKNNSRLLELAVSIIGVFALMTYILSKYVTKYVF